ncbi:MAG: NfeD family protein [Oscillospiraceae bacterium]|nr:NfeD family protein [Oscillospiraceae bacterium]MBR4057577.1 NfeD family protein [Oscillospiraceae bacterium]MBR6561459.1 NfeD family protein [Oscillospiraceae bacterium]
MPNTIMLIVWGVLFVAFLVIEGVTAGLTSIWFALGALVAFIAALCHGPIWLQIALFAVVSVVVLYLTRPLVKKYINSRAKPTNADRVIGQIGLVEEDIDNIEAAGAVRIGGKVWTARSADGSPIAKGTLVRAEKIEGVKLIVSPAEAKVPAGAEV